MGQLYNVLIVGMVFFGLYLIITDKFIPSTERVIFLGIALCLAAHAFLGH